MHIRKGDQVEVIAGEDRGRRATVIRVLAQEGQVLVEGVNEVYRHMRPDQRNPQGGRLQKEAPVDISNVLVVCEKCGKGRRVGYKVKEDGTKVRVCKGCQAEIG